MHTESDTAPQRRWGAFARGFVLAAVGLTAAYLALAYALDPYDSGRSRLFSAGAVRPQGPRTAAALRGRDPAYRAAIIGNSHIQLIEPARLSALTGMPFVQLSVTATGPGEQFVLLDWFLRHHPAPEALVVAADEYWCTDDPALPNAKPFPFWLFASDTPTYLRGLLRWSVLEEVLDRIGWLAGKRRPQAAPDGWWDYEHDYIALGYVDDPKHAAEREARPPDTPEPGRAGPDFPAARRFGEIAARLPEATALVLVFPPVYAAALPRPGSERARAADACKAAITAGLGRHPKSAVVDDHGERPESRDPALFFDQTHYRHPLARKLTGEIAEALNRLDGRTR